MVSCKSQYEILLNSNDVKLKYDAAFKYFDEGKYAKAASLFESAAAVSDNDFTAPMYLRKAALAYRALGNTAKADELLKTIVEKYPASYDSTQAERYLTE